MYSIVERQSNSPESSGRTASHGKAASSGWTSIQHCFVVAAVVGLKPDLGRGATVALLYCDFSRNPRSADFRALSHRACRQRLSMKQIIVAIVLLLGIGPVAAGDNHDNNPFIDMMRAMVNMFEAMQTMQNLSVHSGHGYGPAGGYLPHDNWPANPDGASLEQSKDLQGSWASPNRILLVIRQNLARMYWSADQYRNFYVEVSPGRLKLTDAETRQSQEFEYRLQGSQLALRDPKGRVVQFFRVNEALQPVPEQPPREEYNFWDPNTP